MQIRTNPLKGNMTWDIKQVMSIGEQLYKNKGPEAAAGADASANAGAENKKEDVVDAEFTEKH